MADRALTVIGLMSGTSADGVDSALIRLDGTLDGASLLSAAGAAVHHAHPFDAAQRQAIFDLFQTERTTAAAVCRANFLLGEWFAQAALAAIGAAGLRPPDVDLIGSHGQTIYHCPPDGSPETVACTLQVGEPSVIAERTGITTVADFRVRDVAAGGHGAPLVSYADQLLFQHPHATRVVLNLGGIANVTVLPAGGRGRAARAHAYDTGPANMVLDWLAHRLTGGRQACDLDGRLAQAGTVDEAMLRWLLDDPYFGAPWPKTTGRERFGAAYGERVLAEAQRRGLAAPDLMATATALTAESVAAAVRGELRDCGPLAEVIAGGGGTRNPVLMAALAARLPGVRVTTHEAYGVSSQAKEALSFALLAAAAVRGEPNTVPGCTGARHPVVMGKIVPGDNYPRLMARLFAAAAGGAANA